MLNKILIVCNILLLPPFRIWNLERGETAQEINAQHTEFVCGLDWNPHRTHQLADCGWDSLANVYTPQCLSGELAV
uniref:Peroxisomal targeting signal 2 receptor-like n=1 Tax=Drosophila rhopaloa TaxID=1041015 RepID=A0A6P4EGE6_DRORH